jgi:hypothetical protein
MPWVQVFCTSANTGAGFLHTRCRFLRVPRNPTRTRTPYTRGKNPHRLPIPVPITCWDWAAVVALLCLSHASDTPDVAFACWISLYSLQRLRKKRALLLVSMFARPITLPIVDSWLERFNLTLMSSANSHLIIHHHHLVTAGCSC